MPLQHIFIVYLIGTLIVFLPSFGLAKLFAKAGVPSWKAYIPFYNTWVMQGNFQRKAQFPKNIFGIVILLYRLYKTALFSFIIKKIVSELP